MRKIYFFLFLILIFWSNAQIVNIPDVNFKNYLLAHFDGNQDNQIQVSEAQNVYSINLTSSLSISDITGIEHFSNLTMLIIKYNNITAPVNLSQNTNLNVVTLWGSSPSINISGLSVLKYADLNGKYTPAVNVTAQCTALDTQEVSIEKTDIKIFPNPVEDVLYIRTKEKLVSYEIISSIGSLVKKGNFDKGAFSVNMEGLSKGIYYIKMSNERFTTTSKVIKK